MSATAIEAARAQSWRRIYFNALSIPYWGVHVLAIVGIAITGLSWWGLGLALALYVPRMFFVTGAYHRYFSHRSYKTSRWFQLVLAVGATLTAQKGPLWWAAHHRITTSAPISRAICTRWCRPASGGRTTAGSCRAISRTPTCSRIKDFARFPELRWLNRYWVLPVIAGAVAPFAVGGFFALVWGFAVSQVLTWHGTFTINSLSHVWGGRRYATADDSRNNPLLAVITMGEGWHNNHHHYQVAARQGFYWWEIDCTYYVLRALAAVGLIWELHGVPDHVRDPRRLRRPSRPPPRSRRAALVAAPAGARSARARGAAIPPRAVSTGEPATATRPARADARHAAADDRHDRGGAPPADPR